MASFVMYSIVSSLSMCLCAFVCLFAYVSIIVEIIFRSVYYFCMCESLFLILMMNWYACLWIQYIFEQDYALDAISWLIWEIESLQEDCFHFKKYRKVKNLLSFPLDVHSNWVHSACLRCSWQNTMKFWCVIIIFHTPAAALIDWCMCVCVW